MRILFTSTAGLGHLYPLMPLARAARDARHEVLFAVPPMAVSTVQLLGYPAVATADGSQSPDIGPMWAGLAGNPSPNTYVVTNLFGKLHARAALPPLDAIAAQYRPDLLVSECMEFAGPMIAERAGIPSVSVQIGSFALEDLQDGPITVELNDRRRSIGLPMSDRLPWHLMPVATWLPELLRGAEPASAFGRHDYRFEDAEGPVRLTERPAAGDRRPSVYVTLGSAAGGVDGTAAAYRAVLAALADVDADVLFTIGKTDPGALGPIPANVRVASYVAQRDAMTCDAAVIHGGSGTTVAALYRGLPTVCVPLFADQFHNATSLAAQGLGLTIRAHRAAQELAPAVNRVLTEPAFRSSTARVAGELRTVPTADVLVSSWAAQPARV